MDILHDLIIRIIVHTYYIETYNNDDKDFSYDDFSKEQIEYHINIIAENEYVLLKHKDNRKTNNGNLPYALTEDKGKTLSDFTQAEPYLNDIKEEYEDQAILLLITGKTFMLEYVTPQLAVDPKRVQI